jgi:hypothetical protein
MPREARTPQARGRRNRQRGAELEREVASILSDFLGVVVKRRIDQSREGGHDLTAGPLVVECKRRQTLGPMRDWLAQAERATTRSDGEYPVVVARGDREVPVLIVALPDFLAIIKDTIINGGEVWT